MNSNDYIWVQLTFVYLDKFRLIYYFLKINYGENEISTSKSTQHFQKQS
jgi:hypothetical protein